VSALPPAAEKARYVEGMFARISTRYDRINRVITFGMDQDWRIDAVRRLAPAPGAMALDVGTGTGDFLLPLAKYSALAIGVDFTIPMMRAGLEKIAALGGRAAFVGGDALQLPFADDSFDILTTGFTMRNVTDIEAAFREMQRVTRPGGRIACLEVAQPRLAVLRAGHRVYFERVVPLLARAFGGDSRAYTYLPQSARVFPAPDALAQIMRRAGWSDVAYQLVGLGAAAVHTAVKI
jgi:demethylmenaquinone methyltransferase/2-methoxy-6-polyprenyl-1,4-benzoquinol methylase